MKRSLNEHINKMKYLINYNNKQFISEQAPVQGAPVQNQQQQGQPQQPQQQQGQPQPQQQQGQNQQQNLDQQLAQIVDNPQLDAELNNAMASINKTLASDLTNIAKTTGDRDGQLELKEQLKIDEGLIMAAGAVLAAPKIAELIGSGLKKAGLTVNSQTIQKWGEKLSHFGHAIHDKYIGAIEVILKPITDHMDDNQRHSLAGTILTMMVAGLGVASISGAVGAFNAGKAILATAEGGLSAIKGLELAEKVRQLLPGALNTSVA